MQWELILNEMTNVTGEVFLGLGVGCAQCHDHKFDPILQKDYYSLQSFLSSVWWPEDQNIESPPDQMDKLRQWEKETTEVREKLLELKKDLFKGDEKNVVKQFPADAQEMYYKKPEERTTHEQQLVEMVNRQVRHKWVRTKWDKKLTKKEELKKKYEDLNHQLASFSPKPSLHQAFVTTDLSVRPARTFIPGKKRNGKLFPNSYLFSSCPLRKSRRPNMGPPVVGCLGQLDHFSREPPLHPGHRKPSLAEAFRQGIGRKRQRFRFLGRRTVPSGIVGLVGHLIRPRGLETQRSSPYDHAQ